MPAARSLAAIFAVGTVFLTRQIGDSFATQAEALQRETLSNEARAVRGSLGRARPDRQEHRLGRWRHAEQRRHGSCSLRCGAQAAAGGEPRHPRHVDRVGGQRPRRARHRLRRWFHLRRHRALPAVLEPWKRRHRARSADRLRGPRGRGLLSAAQIAEPARRHRTVHLPRGGEGHDDHVLRGTDHGGRQVPRRRRDRHRSVRHEPGRGVGPALRHRLRHPRLCSGRSGGVSGCEGRRQIPRQAGSRGCHGGATGDRDRGARAGGRDRTRFPILALHGRADPGRGDE